MSKYALIIVDMIKDNVNTESHAAMNVQARKLIPVIRDLSAAFRRYGGHVVFACDSFIQGDFIFQGRMPPHAIRGTGGDEPIVELDMQPTDLYLPKRRMSSFYKTDLDQTLRTWGVDTVAVCGIATHVCVMLTAIDAFQNDFKSVIVSDASATPRPEAHETFLKLYRGLLLDPLFRIATASEILKELEEASRA